MPTETFTAATNIASPARFISNFMHMLCDDIPPSKFADRCGTTINHPAFVLGHCAYYAGVCIEMLGGNVDFQEGEATLYEHGAECQDDASCYPDKDACMAHFEARCELAATFIESCEESVLSRSSDGTPFEGRLASLGAIAAFMLNGHPCFHLGQVSSWRRVAGMGSAT